MEYEKYKLCPTLKPRDVCIVLEQYEDGFFIRRFHEHVPASRISTAKRLGMHRELVIAGSGMGFESIVHTNLNGRGSSPPAEQGTLRVHISYPEPGVLRTYCGGNTKAWSDEVIRPGEFRN